jgi:hypothetical protein
MDAVEQPICIYVMNCMASAWAPVLLNNIWVAVRDVDADANADATSKNPDATKCTEGAMYDVFGNGFHVVY